VSEALYHEAILALAKDRTHAGRLEAPTRTATLDNPLCGDRVTLDIDLDADGTILRIRHFVRGCALCQASAAALAATLEGGNVTALAAAEAGLARALAGEKGAESDVWQSFSPVGRHSSRFDCVRLPLAAARRTLEA
jgi:nitrogen fixation protein NifU and related proteins